MEKTKKMTREERLDYMRSLLVKPAEENDNHVIENNINLLLDIQDSLQDVKNDILKGLR